jgi:hypothetical protein
VPLWLIDDDDPIVCAEKQYRVDLPAIADRGGRFSAHNAAPRVSFIEAIACLRRSGRRRPKEDA